MDPKRHVCTLTPGTCDVTSFQKKFFANRIKLRISKGNYFGLSGRLRNLMMCPYERHTGRRGEREEKAETETGIMWPQAPRSWKRQGEPAPRAFGGSIVLLAPWYGPSCLQNHGKVGFYCSKPPVFWQLAIATLGNKCNSSTSSEFSTNLGIIFKM